MIGGLRGHDPGPQSQRVASAWQACQEAVTPARRAAEHVQTVTGAGWAGVGEGLQRRLYVSGNRLLGGGRG